MFEWLKKLFSKEPPAVQTQVLPAQKHMEKPCQSCGKPISYDPTWKHIPNYCADCKAKYRAERRMITRTCKKCGKVFTVPENVQHFPNYCQTCRTKYRPVERVTRKCRGCGQDFSFPSNLAHWPNYCRTCQEWRKQQLKKKG